MPVYKNEEKNTWYTSFYYQDWQGNRKRKKKEGFARKKDAQEYERTFKLQQSGSCDMSFGQMTDLYLSDCKIRQKPTSYRVKESGINTHILPYFKDMPINTITVAQVRQWQNELLNKGKYGPNYLQTYEGQYPEYPIFLLLFWVGLRSGELLALTLGDFDFEKHTVRINKTYHRFDRKDLILPPKTERSNREPTTPPFIEDAVRKYTSLLYDYKPSDRLFTVSKFFIKRRLEKGAEAAGLPQIRVHDLRHSHASLLIHLGFSPLVIQERLGHENVETTLNTYSHLYPSQQGELVMKLQEVFNR